jgi:hypothetical protein|tara:strand:- start:312 stop:503 length:192 start_codon:yes stop_codon:yes gene_type:complete
MKLSKQIYHYDDLIEFMKTVNVIDVFGQTPSQGLKDDNETNLYGVWNVTYTEKKNRTNAKIKN